MEKVSEVKFYNGHFRRLGTRDRTPGRRDFLRLPGPARADPPLASASPASRLPPVRRPSPSSRIRASSENAGSRSPARAPAPGGLACACAGGGCACADRTSGSS